MDVSKQIGHHSSNFDRTGYLNEIRKQNMWLAIDKIIKDFDFGDEELKPEVKHNITIHHQQICKPHVHVKLQQHK